MIELLIVMALLTMVMALSLPRLSRFMGGRALTEETRRFIALSRYARSQAITLGVPMQLWLDAENGRYGLSPLSGYEDADDRPVTFGLGEDLRLQLLDGLADKSGMAYLTYWPDGRLDESGPQRILIWKGDEEVVLITRSGRDFEVRAE